jgi:hypothetical protein
MAGAKGEEKAFFAKPASEKLCFTKRTQFLVLGRLTAGMALFAKTNPV